MKLYLIKSLLLLLITPMYVGAQLALTDVEEEKIKEKQVLNYLHSQQQQNIQHFEEFHPSWKQDQDSAGFCSYQRVYIIKENLEKVWNTYVNTSPSVSWKSKKSTLGLLYNREDDKVLYAEDSLPALHNGHLLFLNLRLLKGLYHLATAFEITKVSKADNTIEFSYIETGVSRGKQCITLEETKEGYTRIIHSSVIQSDSKFRDKIVYPYFHNKLINAFHRNMKRLALQNRDSYAAL